MSYILGIDLGTSSIKGILFDKKGNVVHSENYEYDVISTQSGYSEQNPNEWIQGLHIIFSSLKNNISDFSKELKALSISGQMHSLVTLDERFNTIRPAILWNDVRTSNQCKTIENKLPIFKITKNQALEGFTLPKILWLQENEPESWKRTKHILLPKDYLNFILTNNMVMEKSDASGTIMLDYNNQEWSEEILDTFKIDAEIMPDLINSHEVVGHIQESFCERYGLQGKIPVFGGGADNALSALGAGIINSKTAMCSIGTSGVILKLEDKNSKNMKKEVHHFSHVIKDKNYAMAVTLSAGASLSWFRDTFMPDASFDEVLKLAKEAPIGSNNLLFAPYIMGERTPYSDSRIRGTFIGIDHKHTLSDFSRSVIEGITFSLRDCLTLLDSNEIERIISVGGGSNSDLWLEIQANVFNLPVLPLKSNQGPATGAAIQAAVGLNWFDTYDSAIDTFSKYGPLILPDKDSVEEYNKYYKQYRKIYSNIKNI